MSKQKSITYFTFKTSNSNNTPKNYQILSEVVDDDQFDDKLEELMSQELVYGDVNYY